MVAATDVAGNAVGTRLHVIYGATLSPALSLQITPANANLLIGATQQFTAVDQLGRPRTDVSWSVDNTSIATITMDSSPTLTGVTSGTVNLTASLGSISVTIQVNILAGTSLPVGTVLWSAPPITDFTTQQIVQAVPTSNGTPDLYSIDQDQNSNVLVRAFSASGLQMWQASFPGLGFVGQSMGDNSGGLLLNTGTETINLDGQSGTTAFTAPYGSAAVGQDGSIYSIGFDAGTGSGAIFKLDANSGTPAQIFTAPIGINKIRVSDSPLPCESGSTRTTYSPGIITSGLVVDANGALMFGYQTGTSTTSDIKYCLDEPVDIDTSHILTYNLASISASGALTTLQTGVDTQTCTKDIYPAIGGTCTGGNSGGPVDTLIPDGNGGALIQFSDVANNNQMMMQSTSGGSPYPAPLGGGSVVLGENNTAFITNGISVAFFDYFAGSTNWAYQPSLGVSNLFVPEGGGVEIVDNAANLVAVDAQGIPGTPSSTFPGICPWSNDSATWFGFTILGPSSFVGAASISASSPWPCSNGEPQQQNAGNPTATITVNFTGNKSQGDQLNFTGAGSCGQELGLRYCQNDSWTFYIEGVATVSDDASKWKIRQNAVITRSGNTRDPQGLLHGISDSLDTTHIPGNDDPCAPNDKRDGCQGIVSVQKPFGQKTIYWLDHPGSPYRATADAVWDSLVENGLFTSKVCNRFGICANVKWFIKLQVDPGSIMNCAQSLDGLLENPISCPGGQ